MPRCLSAVVVCVASFVCGYALSAQEGSICGTVHDEKGALAAHVHLTAFYMGAHSGPEDNTVTDGEGKYCMVGVRPGEYMLTADDPAKGYPQVQAMFYASTKLGTAVTISAESPHVVVSWKIPYKAAWLHVDAHDRVTGKPVKAIGIGLVIRGNENRWQRGNFANNTVLMPPNEDVLVKVSAGGYRPWPNDQPNGMPIAMSSGASRTLDVELEPLNSPEP